MGHAINQVKYTLRTCDKNHRKFEENKLTICAVLYTHAHIDHILGAEFVREKYQCVSYLHPLDHVTWTSVANYAHVYGFEGYKSSALPEIFLEDGQELHIGNFKIQVRHTPGHAPGHVIFYFEADNFIINGDVLFRESFGRVDLPGGDLTTLKESIKFSTLITSDVNWLHLDVEGLDAQLIMGIDETKVQLPNFIIFEDYNLPQDKKEEIYGWFHNKGYATYSEGGICEAVK